MGETRGEWTMRQWRYFASWARSAERLVKLHGASCIHSDQWKRAEARARQQEQAIWDECEKLFAETAVGFPYAPEGPLRRR